MTISQTFIKTIPTLDKGEKQTNTADNEHVSTGSYSPPPDKRDTGNRILILARGDEADKSMASWGCEQLMVMLPFRQSVWLAVWDETNF